MLQCDHHTREMPESSRKWMTDSFFKTVSKCLSHIIQGIVLLFQVGPTFHIFSYFSLLFHENALLSLLFHSKMSFTRKNPEIFPRSLGLYQLTSIFIQGACRLTPQILMLP